ncbi:Molybdopterin biosynthesis protein MoeA [Conexivisphaera calida]|uniref:Molybdopterin biosynthesis protein MoeA n=1 Tax=Conexivisphaera calida TaxID=1874277 RepID=A0A4P2VE92_9ARCH|nr:Molybdopterin biosynthesis protein MoeA [Conexivisphaera calida]
MIVIRAERAPGKVAACSVGGIEKGEEIDDRTAQELEKAGHRYLPVEDGGGLGEVEACEILAQALAGDGVSFEVSDEGRAVFSAARRGFYTVWREGVEALIRTGLFTFASIAQPAHVERGDILAVLEALQPSYVREELLELTTSARGALRTAEYKRLRLCVILVAKGGYDLDSMEEAVVDSIRRYGCEVCGVHATAPDAESVTKAINTCLNGCDGAVVAGGLSNKPGDYVTEVVACKYRIALYGFPMKPTANAILAYDGDDKPLICVPSRIAAFRRDNALDLLLPIAATEVDPDVVITTWNGGLKKGWIEARHGGR